MLVLIFGIIGLFTCAIFSILAWVFGNEDLKRWNPAHGPAGRDTTNAGRILGIIGVAMNVIGPPCRACGRRLHVWPHLWLV